jgi:nickel/cobalt transporter (NicO) family protein
MSFDELISQGSAHAWLFIPTAIVLGALHGLEPGHSKTMMAAFIIAIRGTMAQAVLLGLCAAISHSLLIWVLAAGAIHFGSQWNAETSEPYFQLVSGAIIIGMAFWMYWRTRREERLEAEHHAHEHHHEDDHHHEHGEADHEHGDYQDAHEREHASQIARRFQGQTVTTPQIVLFGLTGGLIPCPAALTVLLVCLQLKKLVLGFALVAAFSFGLALTMVATGALAAWSVQHASRHFPGFGNWARRAPYLSSALLLVMGLFITYEGWRHLH